VKPRGIGFNRPYQRLVKAFLALVMTGCSYGRTPVPPGIIPEEAHVSQEDEAYGHQVLATLTQTYPLERDDQAIERVRALVSRLSTAAHAEHHPWNVFVLRGDTVVNAAATRGNYLFVWTGMLRQAPSDGELAAVISHELGHVLAGHTKPTAAEEASEIMARTTGEVAGQIVGMQPGYGGLAQLAAILVNEGVKALIVNPNSQRLELEADQIGFFLMADAGFDPRDAITLWSRMSQNPATSGSSLQFFSSHPASSDRLEELNQLLPQAMQRYNQTKELARTGGRLPADDSFAVQPPRKGARAKRHSPATPIPVPTYSWPADQLPDSFKPVAPPPE
jgi:predicted Zn-dependent protease